MPDVENHSEKQIDESHEAGKIEFAHALFLTHATIDVNIGMVMNNVQAISQPLNTAPHTKNATTQRIV